jgi:hypothetical protein
VIVFFSISQRLLVGTYGISTLNLTPIALGGQPNVCTYVVYIGENAPECLNLLISDLLHTG